MIPKGLLDEIKRWIAEGLYGHLQINFSAGKIMSVNRVQTVKVEGLLARTSTIDLMGTETPQKVSAQPSDKA